MNFTTDLPNSGFQFKTRHSSTLVDSPVTSENGSTSGISGSGSTNGSDTTLVNAEETYTSSLFQTEPLYQFYDVSGGSHTIKVSLLGSELQSKNNCTRVYNAENKVLSNRNKR